jgi:hypothetical protein
MIRALFFILCFLGQGFAENPAILMNAEAFGFGPSAAIGEIFPYLRERVDRLSYIGTGHTLDIQRDFPYDNIFDMSAQDPIARKARFDEIAKNYDIFLTACDFETARWAKELGLKVVVYDPLTWYWKEIPGIIGDVDLYISQNFFGVEERFKQEPEKFPSHVIVPPLVSGYGKIEEHPHKKLLLVNMGGLSNPFLENQELVSLAKVIFGIVKRELEPAFEQTVYLTSKAIVDGCQEVCKAETLQPLQVQALLKKSTFAFMTSGLGNLYEGAALKKTILWLPPANDSQGQQAKLLQKYGMIDYAVDWHDLLDQDPIDYFAPQEEVLKRIAASMKALAINFEAQKRLAEYFKMAWEKSKGARGTNPVLFKLTMKFGEGGAKQAAECVLNWVSCWMSDMNSVDQIASQLAE